MRIFLLTLVAALGLAAAVAAAAEPEESDFFGKRTIKSEAHKLGGSEAVDSAVLEGLNWLSVHQNPDGSFSIKNFKKNCTIGKCPGAGTGEDDTGMSALALMAFIGSGEAGTNGKFRQAAANTVKYLKYVRKKDGSFGKKAPVQKVWETACAAQALSEYFRLYPDDKELEKIIRSSIPFILKARNSVKCWGISPDNERTDVWATFWCASALRTLKEAGFDLEQGTDAGSPAIEKEKEENENLTEDESEETEETQEKAPKNIEKNVFKGPLRFFMEKKLVGSETGVLKAACAFGAVLAGGKKDALVFNNLKRMVVLKPPKWKSAEKLKPAFAFFTAHTLFQFGSTIWAGWNKDCRESLVLLQRHGDAPGCLHGSFDPAGFRKKEYGRMFSTIMGILTLEVYTRYKRFME
jgi:hypothetical protein